MSDYDSPWKEALEYFFQAFLAFFFPRAYAGIDWDRGYEALDKELQQVAPEAEVGRRVADKLFRVWLRNGQEAWVLVHVEVQSQVEGDFAERMYVYNYRLFDLHHRPVASLAVLGDDRPDWRPEGFNSELWGCSAGIQFPVVKLADYAGQEAVLEADANPFAALVLAHLKTLETRNDAAGRQTWKVRLYRGLYQRGLKNEQVRQLLRLIDWMMDLPKELNQQFWQQVLQFEQEKKMPYVLSIERLAEERGMEKGKAEGKAELLLRLVELHFGSPAPPEMAAVIRSTTDQAMFDRWLEAAYRASSLDEFGRALRS